MACLVLNFENLRIVVENTENIIFVFYKNCSFSLNLVFLCFLD